MTDQVVSIAHIKAKARRAFAARMPLADCALPPHSAAWATYRAEYLRLKAEAGRTSPSLHSAAAGRNRIDAQQGAA